MKMRKIVTIAASSALGLLFAASAHGSITYKFVAIPVNANPVAAGSTVTVNIYLNEAVTGTNSSILAPTVENGMSGAGFQVAAVANGLASPTTITAAAFNADAASNQFNGGSFNVSSVTATLAQVSESNFSSAPGTGVQLGNNPPLATATGVLTPAADVFLATVTLVAGQTPGSTVFNLGAGQGAFAGNTVTVQNTFDLDQSGSTAGFFGNNCSAEVTQSYTGVGSTFTPFTITVAGGAIPEPTSIGLIGIVSAVGLLGRRKRAAV